jgi:hypothetical protein
LKTKRSARSKRRQSDSKRVDKNVSKRIIAKIVNI